MKIGTADLLIIELLELVNVDNSILTMIQKEHQNGDFLGEQQIEIIQVLLDTITFDFNKEKVLSYFKARRWNDIPVIEDIIAKVKDLDCDNDKDIAFLKCEISTQIYKTLKNKKQDYRELMGFLFKKFEEIKDSADTKMEVYLNIGLLGRQLLLFMHQLFGLEVVIARVKKDNKEAFKIFEEAEDQIVYH